MKTNRDLILDCYSKALFIKSGFLFALGARNKQIQNILVKNESSKLFLFLACPIHLLRSLRWSYMGKRSCWQQDQLIKTRQYFKGRYFAHLVQVNSKCLLKVSSYQEAIFRILLKPGQHWYQCRLSQWNAETKWKDQFQLICGVHHMR